MIKSLIILVLALLLVGGAFLSRPTEPDFERFLQQARARETSSWLEKLLSRGEKGFVFKDRFLWVTVERDGRTAYVGAFSTFWEVGTRGEKPEK